MKRRHFIAGGTGIISSGLLPSHSLQGQTAPGRPLNRTTQLFPPNSSLKPSVQNVLVWNGLIYSLYLDRAKQYSGFSATDRAGKVLWQTDLPKGKYVSVGIHSGSVILTALEFGEVTPRTMNCLVRLDPTGATSVIYTQSLGFNGPLICAGESTFLCIKPGIIELWRLTGSDFIRSVEISTNAVLQTPHIDNLSSTLAAVTAMDGSTLMTLDLQSGAVNEFSINAPEVASAISSYQAKMQPHSGHPVVIAATGSDGNGSLYALVLPSPMNSVSGLKIDGAGNGSAWGSFEFLKKVAPIKLGCFENEVCVLCASGDALWYEV